MRIGLLISDLTRQGGTERQALALAIALTEAGHEPIIYTVALDRERCYPHLLGRLDVRACGQPRRARRRLPRRLRDYLDMRQLAAAVREPVDVLNPHGWPAHWAALAAARRLPGRPPIVWMCNDDPWPPTFFAPEPWWAPSQTLRRLVRRLAHRSEQAIAGRIDRIAVLDRRMAERVRQGYGREPDVVRSGVDVERLAAVDAGAVEALRRRLDVPEHTFLLLFAGILMPHRRLEDVIQALADAALRGKAVQLVVVGTHDLYPAYARKLRALAAQLGLADRVTWTGAVPEADLPVYYHACDAFIFPNEEQTWGLAVTEAMACGKPVVVSTGAGVHEVLTDGRDALLVPPRRPDAIADAVERLVRDEELRARLASQGRAFVESTLSWQRYAESMLALFQEALTTQRQARASAAVAA